MQTTRYDCGADVKLIKNVTVHTLALYEQSINPFSYTKIDHKI